MYFYDAHFKRKIKKYDTTFGTRSLHLTYQQQYLHFFADDNVQNNRCAYHVMDAHARVHQIYSVIQSFQGAHMHDWLCAAKIFERCYMKEQANIAVDLSNAMFFADAGCEVLLYFSYFSRKF